MSGRLRTDLRPAARTPRGRRLTVLAYGLIVAIVVLDWTTSAGVVVGILLSIPIVLLSMLGRPRPVILATAISLLGFGIAAALGRGPVAPPSVWLPNRILAVLGIVASGALGLMVQRHRRMADESLRAALSARDTNRLLMALMAHDLRAPLVAASQALEYVERSTATGTPVDADLVGDTRLRLRRNLRVIEEILHLARRDVGETGSDTWSPIHGRVSVVQEIKREAAAFAGEAEVRGKHIVVRTDDVAGVEMGADALVLRQVLAILLDNAVRYSRPGPLYVEARLKGDALRVSVADSGPGLSAKPLESGEPAGSGMGLELCRMLAARAGGSLELEQDSEHGTRFSLQLPLTKPTPAPWDNVMSVARTAAMSAGWSR